MPSNSQKVSSKPGPHLLGDPPKIDIAMPEVDVQDEENSPENLPSIKIYDDDVSMRFLVCGVPCTLVSLIYFICISISCLNVELNNSISLVCTDYKLYSPQDACLLGSLEDGLNALLNIEVSLMQSFVLVICL